MNISILIVTNGLKSFHIVRGRKINHVVLDEEESRLIQISLIGNEVRKTDNWFNESGKVGDYKGTHLKKQQPK